MNSDSIIQNINWCNTLELTTLSFDVVTNEEVYSIEIMTDDIIKQFDELRNGRRIRAAFVQGENEVIIWKQVKNKYRIEYRKKSVISLDITLQEKEIEKIFQFN